MAARRAASFRTRSIKTTAKDEGLRLAVSMTDLTTLEGKDTPGKIAALCAKAMHPVPNTGEPIDPPVPSVAAICVYPTLVEEAKRRLAGSDVRVASVATSFPSGQAPLDVRLEDVRRAVEAGADEIDMVISRGAFLAGRLDRVAEEIDAVARASAPAHLKVILETGELETLDHVREASDLAIRVALDARGGPSSVHDGEIFIKTSTGKISPAATMPVVLVMLESIRDAWFDLGVRIGMKPAGGIRDAKSALHYLVMVKETLGEAWLTPELFRFGASSLLDDVVRQILRRSTGRYAASYDVPLG